MIKTKKDKINFMMIHRDAYFPMIKILCCEIEGTEGYHLRLYSIVKKENYLIPVHQYWHGTISLQQAMKSISYLCKNVSENYITTSEDITRDDVAINKIIR